MEVTDVIAQQQNPSSHIFMACPSCRYDDQNPANIQLEMQDVGFRKAVCLEGL